MLRKIGDPEALAGRQLVVEFALGAAEIGVDLYAVLVVALDALFVVLQHKAPRALGASIVALHFAFLDILSANLKILSKVLEAIFTKLADLALIFETIRNGNLPAKLLFA